MQCGKIKNLKQNPELNGEFVRILTPLIENEVVEPDGVVRKAKRYGFEVMKNPQVNGYIKPENLDPADYRSVHIHLFGTEPED